MLDLSIPDRKVTYYNINLIHIVGISKRIAEFIFSMRSIVANIEH